MKERRPAAPRPDTKGGKTAAPKARHGTRRRVTLKGALSPSCLVLVFVFVFRVRLLCCAVADRAIAGIKAQATRLWAENLLKQAQRAPPQAPHAAHLDNGAELRLPHGSR